MVSNRRRPNSTSLNWHFAESGAFAQNSWPSCAQASQQTSTFFFPAEQLCTESHNGCHHIENTQWVAPSYSTSSRLLQDSFLGGHFGLRHWIYWHRRKNQCCAVVAAGFAFSSTSSVTLNGQTDEKSSLLSLRGDGKPTTSSMRDDPSSSPAAKCSAQSSGPNRAECFALSNE